MESTFIAVYTAKPAFELAEADAGGRVQRRLRASFVLDMKSSGLRRLTPA